MHYIYINKHLKNNKTYRIINYIQILLLYNLIMYFSKTRNAFIVFFIHCNIIMKLYCIIIIIIMIIIIQNNGPIIYHRHSLGPV